MKAWAGFVRTHTRFLLLAVLCIGFSTLAAVFFVRSLLLPDVGLVGSYPEAVVQNGRLVFSPSKPFSAAAKAGIVADKDALIMVNGIGVRTSRDLVEAVRTIRGLDPFTVEVERADGTREPIQITPSFRPLRLDWICLLIFSLSLALMAWAVSWRLPQEDYAVPIVLSALLSLVFTFVMPFAYDGIFTNAIFNIGNVSSWLLVVFAMFFPHKRGSKSARIGIVGAIVAAYVCFCAVRVTLFARWMAGGEEAVFSLYKGIGQAGNVSDGIAYIVLAILLGTAYFRTHSPQEREMLAWMIAGMVVALPPYFFLDQLPEILGGAARGVGLGALSQLFLSVLPVFFLIGLARHGALSLRSFLARYALWASLIALATVLFVVAYLPILRFVRDSYRLTTPVPELFSAGAIMAVVAAFRWPLERLFGKRGSRRSQRDTDPRQSTGLPHAAAGILESISPLEDAQALLSGVERGLRDPVRVLREACAGSGNRVQQEAVDRVAGFLHSLRGHAGSYPAISGAATPREIALMAMDRVRPQFPLIEFDLQGDDGDRISCVPEELVRTVEEVLTNAAEAVQPAGPSRVTVLISACEDSSLIAISDEGAGIEARVRRRLFDPFVTTKHGHPGLGLYFARIMIQKNAGAIELPERSGRGTTVLLKLPRKQGTNSGISEEC